MIKPSNNSDMKVEAKKMKIPLNTRWVWWWLLIEISWWKASNAPKSPQWKRETKRERERDLSSWVRNEKMRKKPSFISTTSRSRGQMACGRELRLSPIQCTYMNLRDRVCDSLSIATSAQIPSKTLFHLFSRSHVQFPIDRDNWPNSIQNFVSALLAITWLIP